jgi:hypothetical protein
MEFPKLVSSLFKFFFKNWRHQNGELHGNTQEEIAQDRRALLLIRLNNIFPMHDSLLWRDKDSIFRKTHDELASSRIPILESYITYYATKDASPPCRHMML